AFCFLASIWSVFDFGAGNGLGRPAAIALELAPTVSTLTLPSCFLPSVPAVFDFGAGDGLCRPAAIALELVATVSTFSLASCFLPSVPAVFDFGAGDGLCRPAAIALELAKFFGLSTGNRIDLPVALAPLAEFTLPLPFRFPTSSTAIFVFGR